MAVWCLLIFKSNPFDISQPRGPQRIFATVKCFNAALNKVNENKNSSAFTHSCPMQNDRLFFSIIHSHQFQPSSKKSQRCIDKFHQGQLQGKACKKTDLPG